MHRCSFYILLFILLGSSCNNKSARETQKPDETAGEGEMISPVSCFQYANEGDTVILKMIHIGESITGTLVYRLKEKDKNMGTIQGSMQDGMLVARYTFMSEGRTSVRQVAFKEFDGQMVEGYGDVVAEHGKVYFKDLKALRFEGPIRLSAKDCK